MKTILRRPRHKGYRYQTVDGDGEVSMWTHTPVPCFDWCFWVANGRMRIIGAEAPRPNTWHLSLRKIVWKRRARK
jgi:hypothetical protein